MKQIVIIVLISAAMCCLAAASPVIYTLSGIGTGSLGADPFSDASFTITSTADTSDITESLDVFSVSDSLATLFVSGLGTATFTIPTMTVDNTAGAAAISAPVQNMAILANFSPAFSSYDLNSSLTPVTGTPAFNSDTGFGTTAGDFSLSSVSSVTFQAEVVPEPSVFALLGIASIGLVLRNRKVKP
jgi:hypothetical protein